MERDLYDGLSLATLELLTCGRTFSRPTKNHLDCSDRELVEEIRNLRHAARLYRNDNGRSEGARQEARRWADEYLEHLRRRNAQLALSTCREEDKQDRELEGALRRERSLIWKVIDFFVSCPACKAGAPADSPCHNCHH